jgi:UDPglucose 6-dehydrogenase
MSFANMLVGVCGKFAGADVDRVTAAMGLDRRIGKSYLRGTMPYGGPCFGRDAEAFITLARQHNAVVPLIEATAAVNERHTDEIIAMLQEAAPAGSTVAVLGLAFRPNSNVVEASPSIAIANALQASNRQVRAWDPLATEQARTGLNPKVVIACSGSECLANAAVVLVANADPAFAAIPTETWSALGKRAIVFDCWRILPKRLSELVDLRYIGVERGGRQQ